jgi:hypothetical protein
MSLSPSSPPGAPSLAEVLIQRTFAKPLSPFVDREFLEALEHADADRVPATGDVTAPAAAAPSDNSSAGGGSDAGTGGAGTAGHPATHDAPAPRVDVRA